MAIITNPIKKAQHEQIIEEMYLRSKAYYKMLASENIEESRARVIPDLPDFEEDADGTPIAFSNNTNIKPKNVKLPLTKEHIEEFLYCSTHPLYTIRNYLYINNQDLGFIKFNLWDFQEELIQKMLVHDRLIAKFPRQAGKTTVTAAFLFFYCLFNKDKKVIIVANYREKARDTLNMMKDFYYNCPNWLKPGVLKWNEYEVKFENGCQVKTSSTTANAARGFTAGILYIDEMAFIDKRMWDKFFKSVFPAVSSAKLAKILTSSTPDGKNHFYYFWQRAVNNINGYHAHEIPWNAIPGRDEAWKNKQIAEMGSVEAFMQEYACDWGDSGKLLLNKITMDNMEHMVKEPLEYRNSDLRIEKRILSIQKNPIPGHSYICTIDCSEGKGLNNQAFTIIDVTTLPIETVMSFKSNEESLVTYPGVIYEWVMRYNGAFIIIENNSIGSGVANDLWYDYEYSNIVNSYSEKEGKQYHEIGIKTTPKTRKVGCDHLKFLFENEKIITTEFMVYEEFTNFAWNDIKMRYEAADEEINDDIAMGLIIFAAFIKGRDIGKLGDIGESLKKALFNGVTAEPGNRAIIYDPYNPNHSKHNEKEKEIKESGERIARSLSY